MKICIFDKMNHYYAKLAGTNQLESGNKVWETMYYRHQNNGMGYFGMVGERYEL
ncbi:hypothetical protein [Dyadobacter psychrotolerans]|uniref:hypothetical protein n=1 Tax=Dyadobacter psychrotolerans TaxID=2541721 RepID=UPI001E42418C|nr:hypothetical protein [Dyadobacter psychrotolerans]